MTLRQLTNKNDPRLSVKLPSAMLAQIKAAAAKDKRLIADEVIRRIGASLDDIFVEEYEIEAAALKDMLQDFAFEEKHLQRFPKEMLDALKDSAAVEGHSLDTEVALRLGATLRAPAIFLAKDRFNQSRNLRKPKALEALEKAVLAEAIARHYEMEKFQRFMQYVDKLPKVIHESFHFIDVEAEGTAILKTMMAEDEANRDPKDPVKKRDWHLIKTRIHNLSQANTQTTAE